MDIFTYLMSKKGKSYLPHKNDLFAYLLGKSKFVPPAPIEPKEATGTTINITALKTNVDEMRLDKESTQTGTPNTSNPIDVVVIKNNIIISITDGTNVKTITVPLGDNEICGIGNYKDELLIDEKGHCYLNKKIKKGVLTKNSITDFNSTYNRITCGIYSEDYTPMASTPGLCNVSNVLSSGSVNATYTNTTIIRARSPQGCYFYMWLDNITDLTEAQNYFENNNVYVYYVLASEQLIDLNYTVDLSLYIGENTITNSEDANMYLIYY